jgi:hypothetical protein
MCLLCGEADMWRGGCAAVSSPRSFSPIPSSLFCYFSAWQAERRTNRIGVCTSLLDWERIRQKRRKCSMMFWRRVAGGGMWKLEWRRELELYLFPSKHSHDIDLVGFLPTPPPTPYRHRPLLWGPHCINVGKWMHAGIAAAEVQGAA